MFLILQTPLHTLNFDVVQILPEWSSLGLNFTHKYQTNMENFVRIKRTSLFFNNKLECFMLQAIPHCLTKPKPTRVEQQGLQPYLQR